VERAHIMTRLIRFLVQILDYLEKWEVKLDIFPFSFSDHRPISLIIEEINKGGPIPFWFNPLWIKPEVFIPLIK